EINRHNRRQIIIADPALATRPIVGVFRATDTEGFAAAAAAALDARMIANRDVIRLESPTPQTHQKHSFGGKAPLLHLPRAGPAMPTHLRRQYALCTGGSWHDCDFGLLLR